MADIYVIIDTNTGEVVGHGQGPTEPPLLNLPPPPRPSYPIRRPKVRPKVTPTGGMKKGGKIPKAGLYKLHKGEVVVPAHRVKTVDMALKKTGRKPLKKVCKNCVRA